MFNQLNKTEKDKIARFLSDEIMVEAIKKVFLGVFTRRRDQEEVNLLAADRLAIDHFYEGWKELEKYKSDPEQNEAVRRNVGL